MSYEGGLAVTRAKTRRKPKSQAKRRAQPRHHGDTVRPFAIHINELRRRLYYIALSIVGFGIFTYAIERRLIDALIAPAGDQKFIYTSPIGGLDFLFRVCIYGGLILSVPVVLYNILRFAQPVLTKATNRFIVFGTIASAILALAGMAFGYFIGLPAALHLLFNQFVNVQVQPLVTIQSYFSFVLVYMVGSALLFQLPLIILLINHIKPLKPKKLLHYERWVILLSFIMASILNPSPNLLSQVFIAGPIILSYQFAIGIVAYLNRGHNRAVDELYKQDVAKQTDRQSLLPTLQPLDDIPALDLQTPSPNRNVLDTPKTDTL